MKDGINKRMKKRKREIKSKEPKESKRAELAQVEGVAGICFGKVRPPSVILNLTKLSSTV